VARVRAQAKFESVDDLISQMARDVEACRALPSS